MTIHEIGDRQCNSISPKKQWQNDNYPYNLTGQSNWRTDKGDNQKLKDMSYKMGWRS